MDQSESAQVIDTGSPTDSNPPSIDADGHTILIGDAAALLPDRASLREGSAVADWHKEHVCVNADLDALTNFSAWEAALATHELENGPKWWSDASAIRVLRAQAASQFLGARALIVSDPERDLCEELLGTAIRRVQYHAAQLAGLVAMFVASTRISAPSPQTVHGLRSDPLGSWGVGGNTPRASELLCPRKCHSTPQYLAIAIAESAAELCLALADHMVSATPSQDRVLPAHVISRVHALCSSLSLGTERIDFDSLSSRLREGISRADTLARKWCSERDYGNVGLTTCDAQAESTRVPLNEDLVEWFGRLFQHLLFAPTGITLSDEMTSFTASVWADARSNQRAARPAHQSLQRYEYPNVRPDSTGTGDSYFELLRVLSRCWEEGASYGLTLHRLAARFTALSNRKVLLLDTSIGGSLEAGLQWQRSTSADESGRLDHFRVLAPAWQRHEDRYVPAWLTADYRWDRGSKSYSVTAESFAGSTIGRVAYGISRVPDEISADKDSLDPWVYVPSSSGEWREVPNAVVLKVHGWIAGPGASLAASGVRQRSGQLPSVIPRVSVSEDRFTTGPFVELMHGESLFGEHSELSPHLSSSNLFVLGYNIRRSLSRTDLYSVLSAINRIRRADGSELLGKCLVHHARQVSEHAREVTRNLIVRHGLDPIDAQGGDWPDRIVHYSDEMFFNETIGRLEEGASK